MTASLQHQTLLLAAQLGGSFYRALATAGLHADPSNRQRLLAAFPELEQRYGPTSPLWSPLPIEVEGRHG